MTPSTTTGANCDCTFIENALFLHRSLIVKSQKNRIELVTRPGIGITSYPSDTLSATSTLLGGGGGLTADHEALDHVEGLLINLLVLLTKRPLPLTMAQVEVSHELDTVIGNEKWKC